MSAPNEHPDPAIDDLVCAVYRRGVMTSASRTARDKSPLPRVFTRPISRPGLITGVLFFVVSLLPSMLPRSSINQGVVSGIALMIGYGLGAAWQWAWNFLEIPSPKGRVWRIVVIVWYLVLAVLVVSGMWRHVGWQNNVRDLFGMDRISATVWLMVIPVTIAVAALILIVARSAAEAVPPHHPAAGTASTTPAGPATRRNRPGAAAVGTVEWNSGKRLLRRRQPDLRSPGHRHRRRVSQPESANRSGSPESIVAWESLGRKGRTFVATGPTVEELNAYHGGGAVEPIRVYAGLKSARTPAARAELVLEELQRTGAFEREVLVVATTTGTGFLEPNAVDSLEYVHNGDTAIAGVQYSYLPSWISLLADQDEVKETSQVVFDTIHGYWSTLPENSRPEIYVYGLSLGSYGVESILTSIDIVNEPIDGALLVGPPFVNNHVEPTGRRSGRGQLACDTHLRTGPHRAVHQRGKRSEPAAGEWGDTKVLYLQHASDPVVFFSPELLLGEPDWLLEGQRGSDLTDDFVWFPFVTMFQVLIDLPAAGSVPEGFGHLYTRQANADAWIAVTEPDGWTNNRHRRP